MCPPFRFLWRHVFNWKKIRFRFFFGFMIFFSGRNFRIFQFTFWILTGKILFFFFLWQRFFFLSWILLFFPRAHFFSRAVFKIFFTASFKLLVQNILFFFSGKKISTLRGHVLVFFLISLCSAVGTLWPNAAGWTLFHCGWFWLTFKKSNFIVCQSFRRLKVTTETSYFFRDFMEPYARMPPEKKILVGQMGKVSWQNLRNKINVKRKFKRKAFCSKNYFCS